MKKSQPKKSAQPFISIALPLLVDLLKNQEPGSPSLWKILYDRLKQAMRDRKDCLELSPVEADRFRDNRTFIRGVKTDLKLRNYILLEVHDTKQWRHDYQSFEHFAKAEAGIGKSQAQKCIDSARVMIDMVGADMESVAPRGRQVEEVIKVPEGHRTDAWRHVLRVYQHDGCSIDTTRAALRDYCRDRGIPFGRRKPNGSKNIGFPSLVGIEGSAVGESGARKRKPSKSDWVSNLSNSEKQVFEKLNSATRCGKPESLPPAEIPVSLSIQTLTVIADSEANGEASEKMRAVLTVLSEKDPTLANQLLHVALDRIFQQYSDLISESPSST